jgi:arylformamidase
MIDITAPVSHELPVWPNSPGWSLHRERWEKEGGLITNSILTTDLHVGTHVEAPLHFLEGGHTVDEMGLSPLVGRAYVVHLPDAATIDSTVLESAGVPEGVRRLLIRTRNSGWWTTTPEFRPNYVALNESASEWCVDRQLTLVGIDFLSVQSRAATSETHRILMRAGVTVLEGLNLAKAEPGYWQLVCLPIYLVGVEAAPARAILLPLVETDD